MFLQQVPQLLEVLLVQDLGRLVLEEASARFLSHSEVERVLVVRLLVEETGDVLVGGVLFFLLVLLVF